MWLMVTMMQLYISPCSNCICAAVKVKHNLGLLEISSMKRVLKPESTCDGFQSSPK